MFLKAKKPFFKPNKFPLSLKFRKFCSESFFSAEPSIGKKSLNSIVKLELLGDKSAEEIEQIWTEFHKKNFPRDIVAAVIRKGIFKKLKERANEK